MIPANGIQIKFLDVINVTNNNGEIQKAFSVSACTLSLSFQSMAVLHVMSVNKNTRRNQ